jgi:hypothetical protein
MLCFHSTSILQSALLLSIHTWLHLLSFSICSSSFLLRLLGSCAFFSFHHLCSIQLLFFISVHVLTLFMFCSHFLTVQFIFTEPNNHHIVTTFYFYTFHLFGYTSNLQKKCPRNRIANHPRTMIQFSN